MYLMSVMSQCYSNIIDQGISAPGYGKDVLDGLNAVDKIYIYQLVSTVKLPVSNRFDSQMQMHTGNQKDDVSLAKSFQHHLTKEHHKSSLFKDYSIQNDISLAALVCSMLAKYNAKLLKQEIFNNFCRCLSIGTSL